MPGTVNKSSPAFIQSKGDAAKEFAKIERRLADILKGVEGAAEEGLLALAEKIKDEAIPLTPVDTGALRKSAFTDSETTKSGPVAVVGFNKLPEDSAPYAVFVHENLEAHHAAPTQAKFLQSAAQKVEGQAEAIVADAIKRKTKL